MYLLNLFHTGGVTLVLTLVWLGLSGWFFIEARKQRNSEYGYYDPQPPGEWHKLADKMPWKRIPEVLWILIVLLLYILCLIAVASDYKGV